jgi:hypothetical protein
MSWEPARESRVRTGGGYGPLSLKSKLQPTPLALTGNPALQSRFFFISGTHRG